MSSSSNDVRYAPVEDVIGAATDTKPSEAPDYLQERAKHRAAAATQKWVNRTGRPFHPVRIGAADEPRTWEVYDVQNAISWKPATVMLDNSNPLPLDPDEGDTIEIRDGRDTWSDVTSEEGDAWTLDYRRKRLRIYERRLSVTPWDDPNTSFVRLTYRYGPLGEDVSITNEGLVESVPADVREAVAAKAAAMLALDDDAALGVSDDGQLTSRSTKKEALEAAYKETAAEYSGFSPV